jgi:hypothetical protein
MFRSRVEGLGRLSKLTARMLDDAALNEALLASGEAVIEAARANLEDGAPPNRRSGALEASLFAAVGPDSQIRIGTPLEHGWHLEMGTLTRPAYPWLTAALNDQQTALVQQVSAWLSGSAKRAGR